ncbi:hypothetical protein [Nocardioides aurantiacus]|uniref:hypothetical protein n=1 Tax=Nocardioides aurantiacus TaxID=86796 RepID=UPI00403F9BB4
MTNPVSVSINVAGSRRRRQRLEQYTEQTLLDDEFLCPHFESCRDSIQPGHQFREGTMSHVGHRYELVRNGKPLRVMVVGQESGLPKDPASPWGRKVTMEARHDQVLDSGMQRRYYTNPPHEGRNPHMRGTTSALRMIFGKGLGSDYDAEFVDPVNGRPFHLFEGFALVNRLLCSAGPVGTSNGKPTTTMFTRCADHFSATVSILEPTLVILQGRQVRKWAEPVFTPNRIFSDHLYEARSNGSRIMVCSFTHPSAHGALRWGDKLDAPYLINVVAPTIHQALRRS